MSLFHQMERLPVSSDDALVMTLESSSQESSLEDENARKEDRPFSSHLFGDNPDEEEPSEDFSMPRKVHYHSKWKSREDAHYWIPSTKQRTTVLPADCIYKVISRNMEKELCMTDSRRIGLLRRWFSRVLGNHSSSKAHQRVLLASELKELHKM